MKRRIITATLALLAAYTVLPAQNSNITVRGGIISEEDGSPVDFASILLSPSNMYSMTDKDGRFSIENVPSGEIDRSRIEAYRAIRASTVLYVASEANLCRLRIFTMSTNIGWMTKLL